MHFGTIVDSTKKWHLCNRNVLCSSFYCVNENSKNPWGFSNHVLFVMSFPTCLLFESKKIIKERSNIILQNKWHNMFAKTSWCKPSSFLRDKLQKKIVLLILPYMNFLFQKIPSKRMMWSKYCLWRILNFL
jgi:hypothetical protein